jgi:hypothetical protein
MILHAALHQCINPFPLAMIKWERVYALVQGGVQDHEAISIRCSIFLFFYHLESRKINNRSQ